MSIVRRVTAAHSLAIASGPEIVESVARAIEIKSTGAANPILEFHKGIDLRGGRSGPVVVSTSTAQTVVGDEVDALEIDPIACACRNGLYQLVYVKVGDRGRREQADGEDLGEFHFGIIEW